MRVYRRAHSPEAVQYTKDNDVAHWLEVRKIPFALSDNGIVIKNHRLVKGEYVIFDGDIDICTPEQFEYFYTIGS